MKTTENKDKKPLFISENTQGINEMQEGLTFDDVLIVPSYSDVEHRSDVDISTQILPGFRMEKPFVSANMDTITEHEMAHAMSLYGGLGILHRYMSTEDTLKQIDLYKELASKDNLETPFVISIGVRDLDRLDQSFDKGIRNVCIDVAHGHHALVKQTVEALRKKYGNEIGIIAGNICTYEGAFDLFTWGADCIKVGVGPGSVCSTRIKTGSGYPQLSAIANAYAAKNDFLEKNPGAQKFIIGDGGIKHYGDIPKALGAGADAVMMGSIFAGCKQTPGHVWRNHEEEMIKTFRGMASYSAQSDFGIEDINEEGIALNVKYKGNIKHIIERLARGLKSGMSYAGARDIKTMQEVRKFVKITQSGVVEGHPHKSF